MLFTIQHDGARLLSRADDFAWAHSSHAQTPARLHDAILRTTQQTGDRVEINHDPMILTHYGHTEAARAVYSISDIDDAPLVEFHDFENDHNLPDGIELAGKKIQHTFAGLFYDAVGKDIMYQVGHEIQKATPGNLVYIHTQDQNVVHASSPLGVDKVMSGRIDARFAKRARNIQNTAHQQHLEENMQLIGQRQEQIGVLQEKLGNAQQTLQAAVGRLTIASEVSERLSHHVLDVVD